jgi:hypothetical protein
VDADHLVEDLPRHIRKGDEAVDPRFVDNDVDAPEVVESRDYQLLRVPLGRASPKSAIACRPAASISSTTWAAGVVELPSPKELPPRSLTTTFAPHETSSNA